MSQHTLRKECQAYVAHLSVNTSMCVCCWATVSRAHPDLPVARLRLNLQRSGCNSLAAELSKFYTPLEAATAAATMHEIFAFEIILSAAHKQQKCPRT